MYTQIGLKIGRLYVEWIKLFHSYNNSQIHMIFTSNKMGPLHIIQELSESILMRHLLRNGLAEEI